MMHSFLLKNYHANESYNATAKTCEDEDGYTATPVVKIVPGFKERTAACYEPNTIISEVKNIICQMYF